MPPAITPGPGFDWVPPPVLGSVPALGGCTPPPGGVTPVPGDTGVPPPGLVVATPDTVSQPYHYTPLLV
ncbi:hypothetical protein [Ornithobacterium rhinotracheale]|uniref:hypothetical protein n=1 Tax=Ornithobacterium rhinotracheale TaxID=28251 RepID=UPI001FF3863D|nr:hypothetical protein [Ornithobacterium rhinotracheale]MCK0204887.1 hypothetical protein [Ornithobacterium rhinotracheale]